MKPFLFSTRSLSVLILGSLLNPQPAFAAGCDLPMFAGARLFAAGTFAQYMATGDFNHDGFLDVVVTSPGKNLVSILLSNGDGTFQPAVNYTVPSPNAIAVADFNRDGKLDLAISANSSMVVMLGNGDGTFKAGITASNQAGAMAVGDFNGDGIPDLALAGVPAYILLGKGDGTFQAPLYNSTALVAAFSVAVGDFNGDGKLDVVTGSSDGIYLQLNDGKGNLSAPVDFATGAAFASMQVAVGDLNGDHKLDVVTIDPLGGNFYVLLGNGNGTFQAATAYALGNSPGLANGLLLADLNGDSKLDVTVAMFTPINPTSFLSNPGTIAVFSGNGDGTFQTAVQYNPTGQPTWALGVGDFNGDGLPDLVFTSNLTTTPTQVGLMFGTATGTFQSPLSYAVGPVPGPPVLADLNGDGVPDMIVANGGFGGNLSVLIGNGDGSFQPAVSYPTAFGASSVAVGDFNGDGKPDIAVANGSAGNLLVFPGNGDGTFRAPVASFSVLGGAVYLAVGDFNKDGKLDLAVVGLTGVQIALGNGDGTFRGSLGFGITGFGAGVGPVAVADLNGDGNLDLVAANSSPNGVVPSLRTGVVSVVLGNGDGTFRPSVDYPIGKTGTGVAIGDLNGDGKPDLAVADIGAGTVAVLLGNGDGTFQAAVKYAVVAGSNSLVMGDFNGDGNMDLAVASSGSPKVPDGVVTVLLGNGDGTFRDALTYGAGLDALSLAVGDVNGDGKPDLVITDGVSTSEVVLLNSYIPGSSGSACPAVQPLGN